MIGQTISHYRVIKEIGHGGMAVVYKAEDVRLKRSVALKFLPPNVKAELKDRFLREARAAAKLDHPNICTVYEIDDFIEGDRVRTFIAMQYLGGKSLKEHIRAGLLEIGEAIRIWEQIAEGLATAHAEGIIHRDIKPGNIIVTDEGLVKIVDFGIALIVETSSESDTTVSALTADGSTVGTFQYMSPEQARALDVDHRTDLWSLGVVAYEMLTGSPPFKDSNSFALVHAITNERPKPMRDLRPEIPQGLVGIVNRALTKAPDQRYRSADEMLRHLRGLKDASGSGIAHSSAADASPSIAVLPFVDMSQDQDQEFFCEGIAEEIINGFMQIEGLRTVARGSSFKFSGKAYEVAEVGEKLGVDAILQGSVRTATDRLRITVQLINVADGFQIWSHRFERHEKDLFDLQDDIAIGVAKELRVTLEQDDRGGPARRPTESIEAYHLYLKGRYYWNSRIPDQVQKAIDHYRAALEVDPSYALAHAGLADAFVTPGYYGTRPPHQVMPLARASASKALELDPTLAEAHTTLGMVSSVYDYNWAKGEHHFRMAMQYNPGYALAFSWFAGFHLVALGKYEESIAYARTAQGLDPLTPAVNTIVGACLFFGRDYEGAVSELEKAIDLEPTFPVSHFFLGRAYWHCGEPEKAIDSLVKARGYYDLPLVAGHLGYCYAASGQADQARELLESFDSQSRESYVPAASRAPIYIGLGENELAMEWLERAYEEERSSYLFWLKADPAYDSIRQEPRFQSILERMNLKS